MLLGQGTLYFLAILLLTTAKSSRVFTRPFINSLIISSKISMDKEYAKYLLNKTRQDYNAIAESFSSTRRFVWQGLEPLYNYALPREKVLDLGCGNGRLLQIFKEIDIDYTGVDSAEKLIEIAKKLYPNAKFQVVDALHLPFPTNHFDKIYSIAVLHHIPSNQLRLEFLDGVK